MHARRHRPELSAGGLQHALQEKLAHFGVVAFRLLRFRPTLTKRRFRQSFALEPGRAFDLKPAGDLSDIVQGCQSHRAVGEHFLNDARRQRCQRLCRTANVEAMGQAPRHLAMHPALFSPKNSAS